MLASLSVETSTELPLLLFSIRTTWKICATCLLLVHRETSSSKDFFRRFYKYEISDSSPTRVAPYKQLLTHFRYFLNLRSQEGRYHSLILFRLSTPQEGLALANGEPDFATPNDVSGEIVNQAYNQLYAMESTCPHLGADMSHADIEESETSLVAVCPWHR